MSDTTAELDTRLRDVMAAVFGVDASSIPPDASPEVVPEWDSVHHLQLMLAIEEEFGIQFDAGELASLTSVAMITERLRAPAGND